MKMNRSRFLASGLICITALSAMQGYAEPPENFPVNNRFSGTYEASTEADSNGDMAGGTRSTTFGTARGYPAGKTRSPIQTTRHSDIANWDGSTFCDFDSSGEPIAVEVLYVAADFVTRYSNRDLLYGTMASSPPSTLCVNFIDRSFSAVVHYDIKGGTGRFESATGNVVTTSKGDDFDNGLGSSVGRTTGELQNVRRLKN